MNKVPLGEKTYCYEEFITKDEQDELYSWVFNSFPWMNFANPCNDEEDQIENPVRHFARIDLLPTIPPLFWDVHDKIVELEGINPVIEAPQNGHWVGLTGKEARVEPHTDWNGEEEGWYWRASVHASSEQAVSCCASRKCSRTCTGCAWAAVCLIRKFWRGCP